MSEGTGRRSLSFVGTNPETTFLTAAFLAETFVFAPDETFFLLSGFVTFAFDLVAISAPLNGFS
jgi:hypothetical protein